MGKESSEIWIDLPEKASNNEEEIFYEWTIETQHDRILFITLSTTDGSLLNVEQLHQYLSVIIHDEMSL